MAYAEALNIDETDESHGLVRDCDRIVEVPATALRQGPTAQTTVEAPQVQSLDRVMGVSVATQTQATPSPSLVPAPPTMETLEATIEAVKHVPQERVPHHAVQQLADVPVPQIRADAGEVIQPIPQARISEPFVEEIVDNPVTQIRARRAEGVTAIPTRVQQSTGDIVVDVPVPQIRAVSGEVIQPIPQERNSEEETTEAVKHVPQERIVYDTVAPVPQVMEEILAAVKSAPHRSASSQRPRELSMTISSRSASLPKPKFKLPVASSRISSAFPAQKLVR